MLKVMSRQLSFQDQLEYLIMGIYATMVTVRHYKMLHSLRSNHSLHILILGEDTNTINKKILEVLLSPC